MTESRIGIFPASGALGGSTLKHLSSILPPSNVVAIVRHPEQISQQLVEQGLVVRQADYDDEDSLSTAFRGISTLNLISYITYVHKHRTKVHICAINQAKSQGVKHVFYSSLAFAGNTSSSVAEVMQAHLDTEAHLKKLAEEDPAFTYTIIRIGLYSESFPIYTAFFDPKNPVDEILIPHDGKGKGVAWAKRDELGEGVAKIMKQYVEDVSAFPHINKQLLLSGPREYSLKETVQILGKAVKRDVRLRKVSIQEYAEQQQVKDVLGEGASVWASAWEGIRRGETAVVTSMLEETLGRQPESFERTIEDMVPR